MGCRPTNRGTDRYLLAQADDQVDVVGRLGRITRDPHFPTAVRTTICVLGKENLRSSSSMTLIWQVYRPGFTSLNGILSRTGSALSRWDSNRVRCSSAVSNTFCVPS